MKWSLTMADLYWAPRRDASSERLALRDDTTSNLLTAQLEAFAAFVRR
jgi:hypothetical protein